MCFMNGIELVSDVFMVLLCLWFVYRCVLIVVFVVYVFLVSVSLSGVSLLFVFVLMKMGVVIFSVGYFR